MSIIIGYMGCKVQPLEELKVSGRSIAVPNVMYVVKIVPIKNFSKNSSPFGRLLYTYVIYV